MRCQMPRLLFSYSRNRNTCPHQSALLQVGVALSCVIARAVLRLLLIVAGLQHARPGAHLGFRIFAVLASHDCFGGKGFAIRIQADRIFLK